MPLDAKSEDSITAVGFVTLVGLIPVLITEISSGVNLANSCLLDVVLK